MDLYLQLKYCLVSLSPHLVLYDAFIEIHVHVYLYHQSMLCWYIFMYSQEKVYV